MDKSNDARTTVDDRMPVAVSVGQLRAIHRDLDACQKVIWLAGVRPRGYGFDPAYCTDAQARLRDIERLIESGSGQIEQQPVATIQMPDPYDERSGLCFSNKDLERLYSMPAGTKLYAAPVAHTEALSARVAELETQLSQQHEAHRKTWRQLEQGQAELAALKNALLTRQSGLVEMVDAAMIEMRHISPPLPRSDCERLIRAALYAQGGE